MPILLEMRGWWLEPSIFSYNVSFTASEKGSQWEVGLAMLVQNGVCRLESNIFSYSAGVSACEKVAQ